MTQGKWSAALLGPNASPPDGLVAWNGSSVAQRFSVYRNNVASSLADALVDTFPVCRSLVGDEFFRAMALEFVRRHPPTSPVLAFYGRDFPSFVEQFPPVQGVPYLSDVARLERAYIDVFHAADGEEVCLATLQEALCTPEQMARARVMLRPTVALLPSSYPIVSLWQAHRTGGDMLGIDLSARENAYVVRTGLSVGVSCEPNGFYEFTGALMRGRALMDAMNDALEADPAFDLTMSLTVLIRDQAIQSVAIRD